MKPEDYSRRRTEVSGWHIELETYRLGGVYHTTVYNVDPGARFARADGSTREEAEARARLANREHFQLLDPATYRQCFADWLGPQDEGLAGYVFGSLLAAKESLLYQAQGESMLVRTKQPNGELITLAVMIKDGGKWKVALRQSVPSEIRERLYQVYNDAHRAGG